ncbi:MAG TPA: hypothetical protein VIY49_08110 [Bryobacteraceae bacterium]
MSSLDAQVTVEDAIVLAVTAHRGQMDRSGVPFIFHCLRVMLAQQDEITQIAAVLHDAVEYTAVSLQQLERSGYNEEICSAVAALTRWDGESYEAYIERVAVNPVARAVKLADLADNMDPRRWLADSRAEERMTRYRFACKRLAPADIDVGK